jgi:cell division protein FtsW
MATQVVRTIKADARRGKRASTRRGDGRGTDYPLMIAVGTLAALGLMMVYSTTFDWGSYPAEYVVKQGLWLGLGVISMLVVMRLNYTVWRRLSIPLMGGALVLLIAVLLFGDDLYGARRSLLGGSIQPSELVKLITVIYAADWLASKGERIRDASYGLIPFAVLVGGITGLIVLQPDFGTAGVVAITAGIMFFLAGAEIKQIVFALLIGSGTFLLMLANSPHGQERIQSYVAAINDPAQASYHVQQALIALGSGGLTGVGLGESRQKFGFLPLPHTDSVFAVLGEEIGLIGTLFVIGLFAYVAYRGFRIALNAPDVFGTLIAVGVTGWIVIEALINVAVMTGVLPLTGIPLPFISYGGSSMVSLMAAVGLLQSVARGSRKGLTRSALVDRGRRNGRPRLSRIGSR